MIEVRFQFGKIGAVPRSHEARLAPVQGSNPVDDFRTGAVLKEFKGLRLILAVLVNPQGETLTGS
jgi:hypothetical protein